MYTYLFRDQQYFVEGETQSDASKKALVETYFRLYPDKQKKEAQDMGKLANKMMDILKDRRRRIGKTAEDRKFIDILEEVYYSIIPVESNRVSYTEAVDVRTDQILKDMHKKKDDIFTKNDIPEYKAPVKKGIIFCHGHEHQAPRIPKLEDKVEWIMVDLDSDTRPDLVGSFNNWETYKILGLHGYVYIISHHCPIHGATKNFNNFIKNVRWLLKPGGKIIIPSGLSVNEMKGNKVVSNTLIMKMAQKYGYEVDFKNNMLKFK